MVDPGRTIQEQREAGDRQLLRNGALFTTAQRAFVARVLAPPQLDELDDSVRQYLALQVFEQYMVSGEDTLSWVCALMEWEPSGPMNTSLLAKLDTIQIGRGEFSEERLANLFETMSPEDLGGRLKLPPVPMVPSGVTLDEGWLQSWLTGLRRIVAGRQLDNRAMVRAYNKAKHGLLGLQGEDDHGAPAVILLTAADGRRSYEAAPVPMHRINLRALPRDIRMRSNWTIQMQAVLQSILAFELGVQFGEWHDSPQWTVNAYELEGWLPSPGGIHASE